jgi:hypothetical protein
MKKFASLVGAGALLLTMAVPAFGFFPVFQKPAEVKVYNSAFVTNTTTTKATSGDVELNAFTLSGGVYKTGSASSGAGVYNQVNSTQLGCTSCSQDLTIKNNAFVMNDTYTKATSGEVEVGGWKVGGFVYASTGAAGASSSVQNFVNTTIVGAAGL